MITAVHSMKDYEWADWIIGIMRSFLSGGAAAFLTGGGGAILGIPGPQVYKLMGINFVFMGLYRLGEFLQLNGAPKQLDKTLALAASATKDAGAAIAEAQTQTPKTP
jgi:hypothetical protein